MKVRELAETTGISVGSVVEIRDSKSCLELFNRNKRNFLCRIVTIDETWIYHYIPESKHPTKQWVGQYDDNRLKVD